jgi:hypothetical protein
MDIIGWVLIVITILIYIYLFYLNSLKYIIPYSIVVAVGIVLHSISHTESSGQVYFIDYFRVKKLEVMLAFLFGYVMLFFITTTIVFSNNLVYTNQFTNNYKCDPYLNYLGSRKGCARSSENMENQNEEEETLLEKWNYLSKLFASPFVSFYKRVKKTANNTKEFSKTAYNKINDYTANYLEKEKKATDTLYSALISPFLTRINHHISKKTKAVMDNYGDTLFRQ